MAALTNAEASVLEAFVGDFVAREETKRVAVPCDAINHRFVPIEQINRPLRVRSVGGLRRFAQIGYDVDARVR